MYTSALILLWIASIVSLASDRVILREGFVVNNDSAIDIFEAFTAATTLVQYIASIVGVLIADGILVSDVPSTEVQSSSIYRYGGAIYSGRTNSC